MAALRILIAIALFEGALFIHPADAEVYRVGVPLVPGICERQHGRQLHGFAVDVWQETAMRSAVTYKLETCGDIPDCAAKFFSGGLDILVMYIEPSRKNSVVAAFSRPFYISGIRILAIDKPHNPLLTELKALSALYSPLVMQSALVFFIFVFIFGNILWFLERKDDTLIASRYKKGIFDAVWCVLSIKTTIGFGDVVPRNSHARLFSILVWLIGLLLINLITADIVSEFSANKIKSSVIGLEDLKGKKIAAFDDNITISELKKIGAEVVIKPTLSAVYEELKTRRVSAAAFYVGIATAYAKKAAQDGLSVKVIPGRYDSRYVSIAIRRTALVNDPGLLDKINHALDNMFEDSYMLFLKSKWLEAEA
ncbi:MAG: transporter substrate-binding domain-containing protein [Nitrospirae bacterium]|nr:transporter substrate-binding domain-containing protein [Nitrospirota bacterium]